MNPETLEFTKAGCLASGWTEDMWNAWLKLHNENPAARKLHEDATKALAEDLENDFWGELTTGKFPWIK